MSQLQSFENPRNTGFNMREGNSARKNVVKDFGKDTNKLNWSLELENHSLWEFPFRSIPLFRMRKDLLPLLFPQQTSNAGSLQELHLHPMQHWHIQWVIWLATPSHHLRTHCQNKEVRNRKDVLPYSDQVLWKLRYGKITEFPGSALRKLPMTRYHWLTFFSLVVSLFVFSTIERQLHGEQVVASIREPFHFFWLQTSWSMKVLDRGYRWCQRAHYVTVFTHLSWWVNPPIILGCPLWLSAQRHDTIHECLRFQ